jgi:protein-tyrosine phosphatase
VTNAARDEAAHAGFDPELRIDWISADQLHDGRPGRLGLTILPGKHGVSSRYPGRTYQRDADADLAALAAAGAHTLVLLVEDHELERWSTPQLVERGVALGVRVVRFPIPDGHPPGDLAAMRAILSVVRDAREASDVAVACMGGVGRTGTVAACALVEIGMNADAAIAEVRRVRHPQAVETRAQDAFVRAFEAAE